MKQGHNILYAVWADLQQPSIIWQLITIGGCMLLAAIASQLIRHWLKSHYVNPHSPMLQTGVDGLRLLLFPLLAWLFVLVGRIFLQPWQHVNLLHVVIPLLFSFTLIRLIVYLIRRSFAPSGWLATWEKLLALLIWLGVVVYIMGWSEPLLTFLEETWVPIGKNHLSLLLIVQGSASVVFTLIVTLWLAAILEARLMAVQTLELNLRIVLTRVLRAVLLLIGLLFALSLVGFDLTLLSVFGGALGVGLGLGLQKIASNYVSGFIILLDRSLRINDLIEVDKYRGVVRQIRTRYTVLRALDGTEAILPNEMLVASPVLNHSFTDRKVRLTVKVGVAYDTDIEALLPRLTQIASAHPRVVTEPSPFAALWHFGDNGIELELSFWIQDPEEGTNNIRSDIGREILKMFRQENIVIPYPQREVRVLGAVDVSNNKG